LGIDNLLEAELVQKFEIQCRRDLLGRICPARESVMRSVASSGPESVRSRFYVSFEHFSVELMGKSLSKLAGGFDL